MKDGEGLKHRPSQGGLSRSTNGRRLEQKYVIEPNSTKILRFGERNRGQGGSEHYQSRKKGKKSLWKDNFNVTVERFLERAL